MPEAGWYQDPHNPNQQRYWDGQTWTEHTHDAPFSIPSAPQPEQGPDYVNDIGQAGFKFENPQAKSTCGCGISFDVD